MVISRRMNNVKSPVDRLKIGVGIALLLVVTGCVGYVDSGYYGGGYGSGYGGVVMVPAPSVYFWGGGYERGYDEHAYSHRGYESRGHR